MSLLEIVIAVVVWLVAICCILFAELVCLFLWRCWKSKRWLQEGELTACVHKLIAVIDAPE